MCPFKSDGSAQDQNPGAIPTHTGLPESIVIEEKAQLDFSRSMSYGDYLSLDTILAAQHPRSPDHNEMLFIVQHQTSELWMKLMLHELAAAIQNIASDELGGAFKMLARVSKIMEQLVHAWDVLATMTPPEYSAIRPYLDNSSGFQSYQYRCIEFSLGNKNAAMLKPHAHRPDLLTRVQAAYAAPSLYDESLRLVARRGIAVPSSHTQRDWSQPYTADAGVEHAWLQVYRNPKAKSEEAKVADILGGIWEYYYKDPSRLPADFRRIAEEEGLARAVCDYVSGMTDDYVVGQFSDIFIPAAWHVK